MLKVEFMTYAILSDVHANLEALSAVLEDLERHSIQKVFSWETQ